LPEDDALRALFDRFLLRCHVDHLKREAMPQLLAAGWALETAETPTAAIKAEDLRALGQQLYRVDLSPVNERYAELVFRVRDLGVALSDRRAVKVLKLVAASALLCGRMQANLSDLWVLRYVWDREEQIGPMAALIDGVLKQQADGQSVHPLAAVPELVDGEEIAKLLEQIEQTATQALSLAALANLRERVADLTDRAAWVSDERHRSHLLERLGKLAEKFR